MIKFNPLDFVLGWTAYFVISAIALFRKNKRAHEMHGEPKKPLSLKAIFSYAFPKHIYVHPSSYTDYFVYCIDKLVTWSVYGGTFLLITEMTLRNEAGKFIYNTKSGPFAGIYSTVMERSFFIPDSILVNLLWSFGVVFMADGARALTHYAFHKVPALWEMHKLHHDPEVMNQFTVHRETLFEQVLTGFMRGAFHGSTVAAFIFLFGKEKFNVLTVVGQNMFLLVFLYTTKFRHSHIWINWSPKLGCFFTAPATHLVHHGVEPRHIDKNFGVFFSVWDMILGTLYIPAKEEHFKIGVRRKNGSKFVSRSLRYYYFGVYADAVRKAFGKTVSYERNPEPDENIKSDELICWCGDKNCKEVRYPFDNPNPQDVGYTSLKDIWVHQKPSKNDLTILRTKSGPKPVPKEEPKKIAA